MKRKRILIAEDDPYTLKYLSDLISMNEYTVDSAKNGQEALNLFKQDPYPIVLTDLKMPVLDGYGLIKEIRSISDISVILVLSMDIEIERVISIMREGVYDYLIKPSRPEDIIIKVNHAYELSQLNLLKINVEKERELRINGQLNWVEWIKTKNSIKKENHESVMQNLKHSFSQGAGIGTIVSIIDMLKFHAKEENGKYTFPKSLIDLLFENGKFASNTLDKIQLIGGLAEREIKFELYSVSDIYSQLRDVALSLSPELELNEQRIILPHLTNPKKEKEIHIDTELFILLVKEIFLNAMKFSAAKTNIYILFFTNDSFNISFLSTPDPQSAIVGIPSEMEVICFEPFFRINKTIDERYNTLEMGLGLTMVSKIMQIHSGKIEITNIKNHMEDNKNFPIKVKANIVFPLFVS